MRPSAEYLNPRFFKPRTWKAKRFIQFFFALDLVYLTTSIAASILISFYRPFLIHIFTIFNGCLLTFSIYALILFTTSANRREILLYYHFYRLLFFLIVIAFSVYELTSFVSGADDFFLAHLYMSPLLFFVFSLLYDLLSVALSLLLIGVCHRLRRPRPTAQPDEELPAARAAEAPEADPDPF